MKKNRKIFFEGSTQHKKIFHRTTTGIKISPIGLAILCMGLAIGMLTGLLFTMFTVQMEGDIDLIGTQHPLFSFDGTEFETPYLNVTADLTNLTSGETKTFHHYIINEDAGAWEINFNLTQEQFFYNDPPHPWYGLNVSVGNIERNGVPTEFLYLVPGDNISFDFIWSLHHEFVTPEDPFPSYIGITLDRINLLPPVAQNDTASLVYNVPQTMSVLANDNDPFGLPLTIINCSASDSQVTLEIINGGTQIRATSQYPGTSDIIRWYDVSNGFMTTRAYLILHLHT